MKKYILATAWAFIFGVLMSCSKKDIISMDRTVFSLSNLSSKSFLATAD